MARHKHNYGLIAVKRHPTKRGYVIEKWWCRNSSSYCPKPIKEKVVLEKP